MSLLPRAALHSGSEQYFSKHCCFATGRVNYIFLVPKLASPTYSTVFTQILIKYTLHIYIYMYVLTTVMGFITFSSNSNRIFFDINGHLLFRVENFYLCTVLVAGLQSHTVSF